MRPDRLTNLDTQSNERRGAKNMSHFPICYTGAENTEGHYQATGKLTGRGVGTKGLVVPGAQGLARTRIGSLLH